MKYGRTAALVAAALVFGLVAGGVVSGGAAPAADAGQTSSGGMGLRLGAAVRDAGGRLADVVATLTGRELDEVLEQRRSGTSFADIAARDDISTDKVVDEAMKVRERVIQQKVASGDLSKDAAEQVTERMRSRLTERVNSAGADCDGSGSGSGRGGRGRGMRDGSGAGEGPRMGGGRGGAGCGGACGAAPEASQ